MKVTEKAFIADTTRKASACRKLCSVCGEWKPLDAYYRPEKDCRCRECSGAYARLLKERKEAEEKKASRKKATPKKAAAKKATPKKTTRKRATKKAAA